ncbi:MAG: heavy metal-responsive transcriptional regulator [Anaerolineae bacterium]|nr:MAG: heavy metal-responsive transcriptional regulator [Anaerolineae bacterium]
MQIRDLAKATGVSPKTIRYYEEIGVLPPPRRAPNGYRIYDEEDVARLQLVVGARRLDLSLDEIKEIIALRERGEAPCRVLLDRLREKADEIAARIRELKRLEGELRQLYELGLTFPTDDVEGKHCVCHLVSEGARSEGGKQA